MSCSIRSLKLTRLILAGSAAALLTVVSASAATDTWVGNSSANWSDSANWTPALPASGDSLTFGAAGTAGTALNNDLTSAAFNVAGITFNAGAAAYTISGNAFTLGGNIANSSTALQTINDDITIGANRTVTTATGGGDVTLGGVLSGGTFGLTKAGAGTLTLAGTGSSIGFLNYSAAGTITNSGSITLVGTTTSTVNAATIFNNTGTLTTSGNVFIANNTNTGSAAAAFMGGNNGTFNQTAGTVNLTSATGGFAAGLNIAYRASTGAYNLSGGTLNVLNAAASISQGGGALGTLAISGGTANLRGIQLTGSVSGAATINLTGGRLNIGASGITDTGGGTRNLNLGGGTVGALADWTTTQAMTLTGTNGATTFNTLDAADGTTARNIGLSGVLSGAGGLVKAGAGTLTLGGANTYAGATNVNGGALIVSGSLNASSLVSVASTATVGGAGTVGGVSVASGGTLSPGNLDIAGVSAGGTLTSSGNVSFADGTAHLAIQLGQTTASGNDQLKTTGAASAVTLNGADLALTLGTGYTHTDFATYLIVNNTAAGATLVGQFGQGSTITAAFGAGTETFNIIYGANYDASGNFVSMTGGNDIALQAVPEPGTWAMMLGGLGMLLGWQRSRSRRKM